MGIPGIPLLSASWQNRRVAADGERYSEQDLTEALRAILSTISKCEKVRPKLAPGSSQHTLLVRRIKAFTLAADLIQRELERGA